MADITIENGKPRRLVADVSENLSCEVKSKLPYTKLKMNELIVLLTCWYLDIKPEDFGMTISQEAQQYFIAGLNSKIKGE